MDAKQLAQWCREYADNKKAENVVILEVGPLSSVADYFVIASANNEPHLRAIAEEITTRLRDDHDIRPRAIDGKMPTAWLVLDFFDVIVHVMKTDVRERYDLETLWNDAKRVRPRKPRIAKAKAKKGAAGSVEAPAEPEEPAE